jgi:hypothetical protein
VHHAFAAPVAVEFGAIREFENEEHTFYLPLVGAEALDRARTRLYDCRHVDLGGLSQAWTWHVTCVRDSRCRDLDLLRRAAASLVTPRTWAIDLVQLLELSGDRYEPIMSVCTRTE